MKNFKVVRISTMSLLLCASVISSCGSSKNSKRQGKPTTVATTTTPQTQPQVPPVVDGAPDNGIPQTTGIPNAPTTGNQPGTSTVDPVTGAKAAPVGHVQVPQNSDVAKSDKDSKKQKPVVVAPDFKESSSVKTGGQINGLNYTSAADDGLMEAFKAKVAASGISADQQSKNKKLAQSVIGAKLKKVGDEYFIDLAVSESTGSTQFYKLKSVPNGNRMKMVSVSATGAKVFKGGFLKCLEDSCDMAYTKLKFDDSYVRVIFRTTFMHNQFLIQSQIQNPQFDLWKNTILNTIQGSASGDRIESVKASSYEIVNGKSAMGIQLLTSKNEVVNLNLALLAPETGTELSSLVTKNNDMSVNYNVPPSTGKLTNLANAISDVKLVNNNGKGQLKIKMTLGNGSIWMVVYPTAQATMTLDEVQKFETTVPTF